jgi:hypothetical protein
MDTAMAADRSREARLDALLDKDAIFDCLVRMSRGSDRFDRDLFLSSCHPDAVLAAGPFVGGREELYDWSAELARNYRTTMHKLMQFTCDIDGDVAHAETYYLFVGCLGEETNLLAGGRYVDRFERRGGVWGLVLRNNFIEWTSAVPAAASPLGNIPDLHLNGLPAHDRSDPSYTRPLVNRRERHIPPG